MKVALYSMANVQADDFCPCEQISEKKRKKEIKL